MHIRTQILLSRFAHIFRWYFRTGEAKIYQLFRHYSVCIFRSEKLLINVWISGRFSIFAQISVLFHFMPCLPTHYLAFFFHKSPFPDPSCTFPDPFTTPFHDNFLLHFLTIKNNFWLKYGYFSRLVWEWDISSGQCLICHAIPLCTTKHYVGPFMDDFDQCTIDWVIFCAGTVTFIHHTVFSYSMPSTYRNVSVAKTPDNQALTGSGFSVSGRVG